MVASRHVPTVIAHTHPSRKTVRSLRQAPPNLEPKLRANAEAGPEGGFSGLRRKVPGFPPKGGQQFWVCVSFPRFDGPASPESAPGTLRASALCAATSPPSAPPKSSAAAPGPHTREVLIGYRQNMQGRNEIPKIYGKQGESPGFES